MQAKAWKIIYLSLKYQKKAKYTSTPVLKKLIDMVSEFLYHVTCFVYAAVFYSKLLR